MSNTKPISYCDGENIIGSEFYLRERRQRLIIRGIPSEPNAVATGLSLNTSQEFRKRVYQSLIENLADLYSLDYRQAGSIL